MLVVPESAVPSGVNSAGNTGSRRLLSEAG